MAFKLSDGNEVLEAHQKLVSSSVPDELSLAALHYLKNEQEEAIDIYKKYFWSKIWCFKYIFSYVLL